MNKITGFLFLALSCAGISASSQPVAGTDDLGRTLLQNAGVGDRKDNRSVGLFYFLWQGDNASPTSPKHWDLTEIYRENPEVFENQSDPRWGGSVGSYYYWGQPVYGYYRGDDYWVHLRNIQLLTDAGVDFLIIDATNRLTYPVQSEALMKAIRAVGLQGRTPPKVVYYTNTLSGEAMQEIYNQYYKSDAPIRYPDTWYYLDGKPLIIGVTKETQAKDFAGFFTFRESQWPTVPQVTNGWPWISFTRKPQVHLNEKGEREIVNVSVAQHPNPGAGMGGSAFYGNGDNWGRSYRNNHAGNSSTDIANGYNFQEQWDYALKEEVPFVFVTGWNEWIAGRWKSHDVNPEHSWFCDQASPEFSRDIEPSLTAGLKDHYYMQLVNNIRRYKGVEKQPLLGSPVRITAWSDWVKVTPAYVDYSDDVAWRSHPGAQSHPRVDYVNNTGRNDFVVMKVSRDARSLHFLAQTVTRITEPDGDNWMVLYLDIDRTFSTGWKGYDFRVIHSNQLQKWDGGMWKTLARVSSQREGSRLMITIPRSSLGLRGKKVDLEFKWSDNMQDQTDPLDWYVNGDAAPGGRFNFIATEMVVSPELNTSSR